MVEGIKNMYALPKNELLNNRAWHNRIVSLLNCLYECLAITNFTFAFSIQETCIL